MSTGRLIKKILLYKSSYFPEPYTRCINEIKVELDFPNYPTKSDFKITTSIETFKIAEKAILPSLKSDIDKLDIDKLEKVSSGLKSPKIKLVKLEVDKLNLLILI